jgi:hypothetical protein
MAGRKPKITEALIDDICQKIRAGASINRACSLAGISRETYYQWRQDVLYKRNRNTLALKVKLFKAVDQARQECTFFIEMNMLSHAKKHWQAAAWLMKTRDREEYGDDAALAEDKPKVERATFKPPWQRDTST